MASSFETSGGQRVKCGGSPTSEELEQYNSSHQPQLTSDIGMEETVHAKAKKNTSGSKTIATASSSSALSSHGRWTKEEHQKFVVGLEKFGRNWKKVEDFIGTRTGAQIRSHAQKYFGRMDKDFTSKPSDGNTSHLNQELKESSPSNRVEITSKQSIEEDEPLLFKHHQHKDDLNHNSQVGNLKEQHGCVPLQGINKNPPNTQCLLGDNNDPFLAAASKISSGKKTDWSKILSAQEQLSKQQQQEEKECQQLQQKHHSQLSRKEQKIFEKNQAQEDLMNAKVSQFLQEQLQQQQSSFIRNNSLQSEQRSNRNSPSDFIKQDLLSSIFKPADIESHLIEFYQASAIMEQALEEERAQEELMMLQFQNQNVRRNYQQQQQQQDKENNPPNWFNAAEQTQPPINKLVSSALSSFSSTPNTQHLQQNNNNNNNQMPLQMSSKMQQNPVLNNPSMNQDLEMELINQILLNFASEKNEFNQEQLLNRQIQSNAVQQQQPFPNQTQSMKNFSRRTQQQCEDSFSSNDCEFEQQQQQQLLAALFCQMVGSGLQGTLF